MSKNNNNSGQPGKDKEKEASESTPDVAEIDKIIAALTNLQLQNRRAAKYQYASYRAQLQHHENLKKIVIGFNKLTDIVLEKLGASVSKITLNEDESLLIKDSFGANDDLSIDMASPFGIYSGSSVLPSHPSSRNGQESAFHNAIIGYKEDPHSPFLRQAILNITEEKFQQLRELSFEVLLPAAIQLLREDEHRNLALFFIAQGTVTPALQSVFCNARNRHLIVSCIKVIDSVPEQAYETELIEDLRNLRQFLSGCLATPITSPKLY